LKKHCLLIDRAGVPPAIVSTLPAPLCPLVLYSAVIKEHHGRNERVEQCRIRGIRTTACRAIRVTARHGEGEAGARGGGGGSWFAA